MPVVMQVARLLGALVVVGALVAVYFVVIRFK
jgi:hypothetical protein